MVFRIMKFASPSNIAFAVLLLCLYPSPHSAHAYLDPGTGSYALQITVAALFTALYSVKLFWKNIVNKLKALVARKDV